MGSPVSKVPFQKNKIELQEKGFSIMPNIYSAKEITKIRNGIASIETESNLVLKTKELFAMRQFLKTTPGLAELLFNEQLHRVISSLSTDEYFLTKAIYFDKPSASNWFVSYHQDLSISVKQKTEVAGYTNWTFKKSQYGVQPPLHILEDTITIRIHLDDTDESNGALRVIPKSHAHGVIRQESAIWNLDQEETCCVKKGGMMLMKPLLLHASQRSTSGKRRRVIHLELNKHQLAKPLEWLEYQKIRVVGIK